MHMGGTHATDHELLVPYFLIHSYISRFFIVSGHHKPEEMTCGNEIMVNKRGRQAIYSYNFMYFYHLISSLLSSNIWIKFKDLGVVGRPQESCKISGFKWVALKSKNIVS